MFVLCAYVRYQVTFRGPCGEAFGGIQSFLVGPAVVIDKCRSKVIPIGEGLPGDSGDPCVNGFHLH